MSKKFSFMLVKKIQFCHRHFSRRSFGNLWFLGTLCMYIHDSKIFLKYMLDCVLCLSSLAATIRWKCSHFIIFLWSKVLLQDQRVTVDFEAESASAGPDNIVFFFLSSHVCLKTFAVYPTLYQSTMFETTKGNVCFNDYVFFAMQ